MPESAFVRVEETPEPHGVSLLGSPVRRAIVDALTHLPEGSRAVGLTAAELGGRLGLHTTTIRFHVDQLVAAGVVDAHFLRSGGVGRPSKKYVLREVALGQTAGGASGTKPFEVLAGLLASAMSVSESDRLTPEEAGVRWALRRAEEQPPHAPEHAPAAPAAPAPASTPDTPTHAPAPDARDAKVHEVIELLGEWGYTPETEPVEGGTAVDVTLRECPFLDLAHTHPDVVCGVHRGLLRGALTAVGEPDARVSLQPFVGPDTCRARLYLPDPTTPDTRSAS